MQAFTFTVISILVFCNAIQAQKQAANWVFGHSCGLDFNTSEPKGFSNVAITAVEGSAIISDKLTGELQFYTDGRNFWNANHDLMPSSNSLPAGCATTVSQPAIIIPDSNNENLFHVFCLRHHPEDKQEDGTRCTFTRTENTTGLSLFYTLIDMDLDSGKGDLVTIESNKLLETNLTEKLTAVLHGNGTDYWVIVHGWNSNRFYSFLLTSQGVMAPIITDIGSIHGFHDYKIDIYQELGGLMKASPNGKKIACAVSLGDRPFDLFDFNNETGELLNYTNLGNVLGQYGVSFSPSNDKLYVTSDGREPDSGNLSIIIQYDLSAGSKEQIIDSRMSIISGNPNMTIPPSGVFPGFDMVKKGMALGIDGRLYVVGNTDGIDSNDPHVMVVIDQPNEKGYSCDVNIRRFDFGRGVTTIGLPNFMQHFFNNLESNSVCRKPSALSLSPIPFNNLLDIEVLAGCDPYYNLTLINSLGQNVFEMSSKVHSQTVDLSNLANGLYFCLIKTKYNGRILKKLVKQ